MVQWPLNGRLLFSELPGHLPLTGWGKNRFLGPTLNFDRTCICATEHDINNRKETCQSTGTPLHAPNLMNFGSHTADKGWRVFAHPPPTFSHWETLPALPHGRYMTDSRQTLARVM